MSLLRSLSLRKSGRHWFFLIAFVAMMMNQLAATGFVHSALMPGGTIGLPGDICTTVAKTKLPLISGDLAPAQGTSADHSCCGACLAGGAPLASAVFNGVSPAPTGEFHISAFATPRPALLVANSHRPRGPPLV